MLKWIYYQKLSYKTAILLELEEEETNHLITSS